jgi:tetratricopeptide (TPR) repeat protein
LLQGWLNVAAGDLAAAEAAAAGLDTQGGFAGVLTALTLSVLTSACAEDGPLLRRLAASNTLLAAAEGQSDLAPMRASSYGDYLAGLVAGHRRDLTAAADHMIRALERDPDNPDLLVRAFALSAADGRQAESLRLARRLIEIEPNNATANLVLAVDAVVRDDPELAAKRLDACPRSISPCCRAG